MSDISATLSPIKKSIQPKSPNTVAHQSVCVSCQRLPCLTRKLKSDCISVKILTDQSCGPKMMCKNALETEWQQFHDHELEPGHDTTCTSRREREQIIRTLRTGKSSERFALMPMVLYWFVCGVFLSLFLVMTAVNSEWSKTNKIKKSLSERACAVEVCFTCASMMMILFLRVCHQSE